jgi:serine phosphatase RsbU (regulator of sigma subunit)
MFLCVMWISPFLFFATHVTGIDSLTRIISSTKNQSDLAKAYFERAKLRKGTESAKRIIDYLAAVELCQKHQLNLQLKEYQKSFLSYLYYSGRIQLCLHYYLLFTNYMADHGLENDIPDLYNIYGNLLSRQSNYGEALNYYQQSLAYAIQKKDSDLVHKSYLNIGVTKYKLGDFDSAAIFANKAIPYYQRNKPRELKNILELKAESYYGMGMVDTAKVISEFILSSPFENHYINAYAHTIAAKVFSYKHQNDSALNRYEKALIHSKIFGSKELTADICEYLSKLFESKGNYKASLEYARLHKVYSDSVQWQKDQESLDNLQLNFEIAKDRLTIREQNETIEKTSFKLSISLLGSVLLILLFGLAVYAFLQKKKSNEVISSQKKIIEEKNLEMEDSIRYAQKIQETLLANKELANTVIPDSFLIFKPRDIVSGDFYWAAKKNNLFYLAVCDSTGHGVPGAFMSLLNINFLNEAVNVYSEPHDILNETRKRLKQAFAENERKDGMDGIVICLNTETGQLSYAAAHNKPIIVNSEGVQLLHADKMHVGIGLKDDSFTLNTINYSKGDMLYLNTDGFCDQFGGPKQKKFMQKQLSEKLMLYANQSVDQQKKNLTEIFDKWKVNTEQTDDVCIIGIRL